MTTLKETLQHIANILSFNSDDVLLKETLSQSGFDWDSIVKIGSKHLVLPTIYCRLKAKELLDVLPKELDTYLKEITSINRNRNKTLLNEVKQISNIFNDHNINHVFLKGTALIAANYYNDIGERMIGDIDVLVASKQMKTSFELLISKGYSKVEETLRTKYFDHKHLPRLVSDQSLGAVEIHSELLSLKKTDLLNPIDILNKKRLVNGAFVQSELYMLKHNVLNFQINDLGAYYNSFSLRPAYDSLVLIQKHNTNFFKDEILNPHYSNYFVLLSLFFNDINQSTLSSSQKIVSQFFVFKLKNERFGKFWHKILFYYKYLKVLFSRFILFSTNSNYRKDIIKNRNRILKLLKK